MIAKSAVFSFAMVLALSSASFAAPQAAQSTDEQAVMDATSQFYAALNAMFTGDAEPMSDVWSHADDVTYMGPDGSYQVGWDQVQTEWQGQAAMKLGGKVEPSELRFNVGSDIAAVQCYEQGSNRNSAGEFERVMIRATNLFRKENGAWKMIGHHTDLLPFLTKPSSSSTIITTDAE